jgi:hypothetical protein
MIRHRCPGSAVLAIAVLIGVGPLPVVHTPATGQEVSAEDQAMTASPRRGGPPRGPGTPAAPIGPS